MVWSIIITLWLAYTGLGIVLFFMQPKFLYSPMRQVPYRPDQIGLDYEDVILATSDGVEINGWYLPAKNAEFTVLFCHGNGGNMAHRLDSLNIFNELGVSCFVFDYRGYGQSEGKPSEQGTYLDAAAAYKWLVEIKGICPDKIIVFGRSLGGSIAAYLAGKVDCAGLIVESSFTCYVDMGKKFYPYMPVRMFARFKYKTVDYLDDVDVPVLIIHSRDDEIVPFEFGLNLYEAAGEPKEFVEISGCHNDGFLYSGKTYTDAVGGWLRSVKKIGQNSGKNAETA